MISETEKKRIHALEMNAKNKGGIGRVSQLWYEHSYVEDDPSALGEHQRQSRRAREETRIIDSYVRE